MTCTVCLTLPSAMKEVCEVINTMENNKGDSNALAFLLAGFDFSFCLNDTWS